ncbi:MAG: hypothetical protein HUJ26_22235 [Planctomycetaceae bacterium]|nr:hypothetical protein [Planctomycetaceae bacterium]
MILALLPANASAIGGKIGSPQIGHRGEINKAHKERVHHLIRYMRDELTFIEGSFINEYSTQRFGGTSEKASRLIGLLKAAGVWKVEVRFREFGEQETALTLHQDSSDTVTVTVNSGRDDFLLKDFAKHLPQPGGGLTVHNVIQADKKQQNPEQSTPAPKPKGN